MSEKTLSLINDEILLTDVKTSDVTAVKNFFLAFLEKDGTLRVSLAGENGPCDVVYKNVGLAANGERPQGCENTLFFGLENKIVFVSRKDISNWFRLSTNCDTDAKLGALRFLTLNNIKLLPEQDAVIIGMRQNAMTCIVAHKSDCDTFEDVLTKRRLEVLLDEEENVLQVSDVATRTLLDRHRVSSENAKYAYNCLKKSGLSELSFCDQIAFGATTQNTENCSNDNDNGD